MTPNQSHVAWLLASILEHQAIAERYGWNGLLETLESCMEMLAKAAPAEPQSDSVPAEAVGVVGYLNTVTGDVVKYGPTLMDWDDEQEPVEPLMTVAQHKRILAAQPVSAKGGE